MSDEQLISLELTSSQVVALDKIFDLLTEDQLKAGSFSEAGVEDVYGIIAATRNARDINHLWESTHE